MGRKSKKKAQKYLKKSETTVPREVLSHTKTPIPRYLWFWLIAITLVPFMQVVTFNFLNFDDTVYILENPFVATGISGANLRTAFLSNYASNWHPLTWILLMIEVNFFGLNAWGFHAVNLLLHIFNVMLLFLILSRSTQHYGRSFFVACLFAIHPMHVQSVAWITEVKDVLSTALAFTAIFFYIRRPDRFNLWCFVFYIMSLMSKQMFVTMPFVLLIMDYWPLQRLSTSNFWARVFEKIPYCIAALIASGLTMWAQTTGGAVQTFEALSLPLRLQNSAIAYIGYIQKLFLPTNLTIYYPYIKNISLLSTLSSIVLLAAITTVSFLIRRKMPYLITGWIFFLITLFPVIGIIQIGSQAMADRYTYVPYIGLFWMLWWLLFDLLQNTAWGKKVPVMCGCLVLLLLVRITYGEIKNWKDSLSLFQHAVEVNPGVYLAQHQLSVAYYEENQYKKAKEHLQKAQELLPDQPETLNQLGLVLVKEKNFTEAEPLFKKAISLRSDFEIAHNNLGGLYWESGRLKLAQEQFKKAIEINPGRYQAYVNFLKISLHLCDIQTVWHFLPKMTRIAESYPPIRESLEFLKNLPGNTPLEKENACKASQT